MPASDPIRLIRLSIAAVSGKTKWAFVEIETESGAVGLGEATLSGQEAALAREMRRIGPGLIGTSPSHPSPSHLLQRLDASDLPTAAIISALDQGLCDLAARQRGQSLCDMLGQKRAEVDLYANINRRTEPRTPKAFAESARLALAAGFTAVKLAPFDEVTPKTATLELAAAGLERIATVKSVLPLDAGLFVDCHWRFTPAVAAGLIAPLRERGVSWYECPIAETEQHVAELRSLRRLANEAGMVLAGLEQGIGSAHFEHFACAGTYDVMMPDIKYVGGVDAMLKTGETLSRYGVVVSPHNPTGPVCHAASLAACGALENVGRLEMQFDESPHFDRLVGGRLPPPRGGRMSVPADPGLGVSLDRKALQALPCDVILIA
jgi:galactonate dehydratase